MNCGDITLKGHTIHVNPEGFTMVPNRLIFELSGEELKRLCLLNWRYQFFLAKAKKDDPDCDPDTVLWESQESLCELFGMSTSSRTKVGKFLMKMESLGLVKITRTTIVVNGKVKPKHYIRVNMK